MQRGRKVFENQCAKCHKFEGVGHEVGPNLDGAARDIEYLLVNILDPNRVVGQPYYTRLVTLKNGRIETGLLAAEDDRSITLKAENDALKVIEKKDIDELVVESKSVMPEGLSKNMTPQEFRDLIRYLMANPFLTEVAVTGPLTATEAPSVKADLLAGGRLAGNRPIVGPPGRIPLPGSKGDRVSVVYVATEVASPAAMHTRLLLGAGYPVEAWLNGKRVYSGKPGDFSASLDQASCEIDLRKGANNLVFQITYRGDKESFYARLVDPERMLRERGDTK